MQLVNKMIFDNRNRRKGTWLFVFYCLWFLTACSSAEKKNDVNKILSSIIVDMLLIHDLELDNLRSNKVLLDNQSYLLSKYDIEGILNQKEILMKKEPIYDILIDSLIEDNRKQIFFDELEKIEYFDKISDEENSNKYAGILHISNIALIKNKKIGVLYYNFICGGECGSNNLVFFEMIRNKWEIILHHNISIY